MGFRVMKRYPEYKGSGVDWIGEIPSHWNLSMLKYMARLVYGDTLISENRENGVVPVYGSNGIIDAHSSANTLSPTIIVGRKGSLGKIQYSDVPSFVIDTAYFIDRRTSHVNLRWLHYVLQILKLERFRDSVIPGLKREYTERQSVPLIAEKEQTQIANFLDRKTGQIDELIGVKERKIELLREQRTALINQAVTKGLDPNVEMKPSGVERIREIPAHWEIIKLRYLGVLQNGITKNYDSFGLGQPFLSYGDVYYNETLPTQVEGLVKTTAADREKYSVKERDVFFTRTSETIEEIGISSTCMKTIEDCVFSGFLIRYRNTSGGLTKEFSKYCFPSHLHSRIFLAREMNIVTRSSLSQELLKRLPVLLPPTNEQKEIATFLDEQTQNINSMIEKEHKQTQLLKEYRQSLISDAVTGKIDVRSEV